MVPGDLFSHPNQLCPIPIQDGQLFFGRDFSQRPDPPGDPAAMLAELIETTPWRAETIRVWGKEYLQPRLSSWHGDADAVYAYSGLQLTISPWTPLLDRLRRAAEAVCAEVGFPVRFNSVLLNYYRNQRDGMGMHADDEAELGRNPTIASVSFGATRRFVFKHQRRRDLPTRGIDLCDDSILVMAGALQHHWLHGIHKLQRPCGARVNLTFRRIGPTGP